MHCTVHYNMNCNHEALQVSFQSGSQLNSGNKMIAGNKNRTCEASKQLKQKDLLLFVFI